MLVLARNAARREKVKMFFMGVEIVVTVLSVNGQVVRLGFEAPPSVNIARGELLPDNPVSPPSL